jgi:hypothetical protein|tara:strand:- start:9687 stop:9821 length:135 start_codon:yes stop_codon:yes gene_type:complete
MNIKKGLEQTGTFRLNEMEKMKLEIEALRSEIFMSKLLRNKINN